MWGSPGRSQLPQPHSPTTHALMQPGPALSAYASARVHTCHWGLPGDWNMYSPCLWARRIVTSVLDARPTSKAVLLAPHGMVTERSSDCTVAMAGMPAASCAAGEGGERQKEQCNARCVL
jgi:hypothetical protein